MNESSRKLTNAIQTQLDFEASPTKIQPSYGLSSDCIISPPLSLVKEQPKFPSSRRKFSMIGLFLGLLLLERSVSQSRLYIKLEVFDHTNYSSKGRFLGHSCTIVTPKIAAPTGFVVRTKQTRPFRWPRVRCHQWRRSATPAAATPTVLCEMPGFWKMAHIIILQRHPIRVLPEQIHKCGTRTCEYPERIPLAASQLPAVSRYVCLPSSRNEYPGMRPSIFGCPVGGSLGGRKSKSRLVFRQVGS